MRDPTFAPAYLSFYPMLSEVARKHGYALAAHGSLVTDFDLVAIPWTDTASSAETLMEAVSDYAKACMQDAASNGVPLHVAARKPHGRLAWAIPLDNGAVIDLSVMPREIRRNNVFKGRTFPARVWCAMWNAATRGEAV